MLRLSVIIPVVRTLPRLEDTLVPVLEYGPDGCEVIVVLDQPYSDPYGLEGEITFIRAGEGLQLARALNLGCRAANGEWIHFLPCGNLVARNWAQNALAHAADRRIGIVVPLTVDARDESRILAAGMGYDSAGQLVHLQQGVSVEGTTLAHRSRVLPHFSGAFFRRDILLSLGGADESLGDGWVLADVTLRFFRAGFASVLEPACVVRGDPALEPVGFDYAAARDAERFFWRWSDRRGSTILRHLALLTGQTLAALPRGQLWPHVAGRLAGWRGSAATALVKNSGPLRSAIRQNVCEHSPAEASYIAKAG
ncbi:glycosyltransferase family 2 protein [Thermogutta sp.]|uniref:glycosyltransferase family 2 protein n=1 Tax=Thermogutta sp. TaxID=1962930 RepID=UPI0032204C7C